MISPTLQEKLTNYQTIYEQLKSKLKWKVSDKRTLMVIATSYIVNKKDFQLARFIDLSDYIKDQVGTFSTLKSYQRFTTAAMLDVRFANPKEKFHDFIRLYEQLVNGGFGRGSFTYISAAALLTLDTKEQDYQAQIDRALAIYKGMRSKHFFLTSSSDYPLAVLLSGLDGEVDSLINRMEEFYDKLNHNGFRKGNDLQFLSHILSLAPEKQVDALVSRSAHIFDSLKQSGLKIKGMHYPEVGMLALLDDGAQEGNAIYETVNQLNDVKDFKWQKDFNLIFAVNFVVSEKLEDNTLLEAGLHTTMEAIIQAQQAAMIAAIAGASAASSSSGSN